MVSLATAWMLGSAGDEFILVFRHVSLKYKRKHKNEDQKIQKKSNWWGGGGGGDVVLLEFFVGMLLFHSPS